MFKRIRYGFMTFGIDVAIQRSLRVEYSYD